MSTLGLVAVILLAVVVVLFAVLGLLTRRRNSSGPAEQQPRTVADLVRLRAEQASSTTSEAPTARVVTVPVVEPDAPTVEIEAADLAAVPDPVTRPVVRTSGLIAGPSGRLTPIAKRAEPVAAPVVEPAPPNPSVEPSRSGDTPWGRAARVAHGESAFWAPAGAAGVPDEPEPQPEPAETPRPEPSAVTVRTAAPVWVAPERKNEDAGWNGYTDWAEVDASDDDTPATPTEPLFRGVGRPAPAAPDAVWTPPEAMKESAESRPFAVVSAVEGNSEPTPPRPLAVVPPVPADRPVLRPLAVVPPLPVEASGTPDDQGGDGTEDAVVVTFPAAAPTPPAHAPSGPPTGPESSPASSSHEIEPAAAHPAPPSRPPVTPPATPPPLGPVDVVAPPAPEPDAEPEDAQEPLLAAAFSGGLATRTAARPRRTAAETAAEQAAADLALLRTFGFSEAGGPPDGESMTSLTATLDDPAASEDGSARPVRFHVVGRDGKGVGEAAVALLDDRGRETATAVADTGGRGELRAPHAGSYVLVSTAADHQPGAVAITVADEPVDAEVLLARSASLAGTVFGEDGPVVGARLTLVQDGEIVDSVISAADGTYRVTDLAAGEYGLSVTAADCEPVAALLDVQDEQELRHDVDLEPAGIPSGPGPADSDDLMIPG